MYQRTFFKHRLEINKSKYLQEFYDEFLNIINRVIKKFVPLKKKNRKSKIYSSSLKILLKEKQKLHKKSKLYQLITKKKQASLKNITKGCKKTINMKKASVKIQIQKSFTFFIKLKLKIAFSFHFLLNENNLPLTSNFDKPLVLTNYSKKYLVKIMKMKILNLLIKIVISLIKIISNS